MSWDSAPKLNGIYLYSYLIHQGLEVELVNSFYSESDFFERLVDQTPLAVVISTTFIPGKKPLRRLVDEIKGIAPDLTIIAGGPLVYLSYLLLQRVSEKNYDTESPKEDFLFLSTDNEPSIDHYIISLRGEQILADMLKRMRAGKPVDDLPNTARLVGRRYEFSPRMDDHSEDHGIDWPALPDRVFKSGVVPLQASIGCPYKCSFCNFTKDRRLTYVKPVEQLLDEMREVSARGAKYVWFVDDNFRLGKNDLNEVCQRFIEEEFNLSWMTFVRASTLKDVDIELLHAAGCVEVQLGLESADPQILRNMNKKASPALYSRVLERLLKGGINCSCYFIFGFPGETEETASRTRRFIKNHEFPDSKGSLSWSFFPFMLTPLSPIYEPEEREKYDLRGYLFEWEHRTMNTGQAREQVLKAFFEMENSGPIYREDNQYMLNSLGPTGRREFEAQRHRISKQALRGKDVKDDILKSFAYLEGKGI
ncbi:MAG: radical SAM protein [Deltaproteobacteria bacterium]|nr:radical SAM protein [Deltaproteobacteria bacterium]